MKQWFSEHKRGVLLSLLGTLLPVIVGCILWNRLPSTMNIHWGVDGTGDGTAGRAFAVFGIPGILAVLNMLFFVITAYDPGQKFQNKKALGIIFWIMPIISWSVSGTIYAAATGRDMDVTMILPLLLGGMFIFIGNYMPKVKQNYTLGIKLSWTYGNEENWNKTHRFAGRLWVVVGAVVFLTVFLPLEWSIGVLIAGILVAVIGPTVYSYRIYKAHKAQGVEYKKLPNEQQHKRIRGIAIVGVAVALAAVAVLMFTGDITYTCAEDALQITATYDAGLTVAYEEIDTIELQESFSVGHRVVGFNSARLSMGAFKNEEQGNYTVYAYNACESMILIRAGEKYLAINAQTPEETKQLYETLLEKTGK